MTKKFYVPGAEYIQFMSRTFFSVLIYFLRLLMECDLAESNDNQIWTQRPWKHIIAFISGFFYECFNFHHFFEVRNEMRPGRVKPTPKSDSATPKTYRNFSVVWWTRPFFCVPVQLIEIYEHYKKLILEFLIFLKTQKVFLFSQFW